MDNRYYNYSCPPLMNDGRFISNYTRSSTFDQYIRHQNKINSAHEYKHYLQNNGDKIINNIKAYLHQNNTCYVGGKCLPMTGPITPIVSSTDNKEEWYNTLLDEEPTNDEITYQPTFHTNTNTDLPKEECSSCTR